MSLLAKSQDLPAAADPRLVNPEEQMERPVSPEAVIPLPGMNLEPVYDRI